MDNYNSNNRRPRPASREATRDHPRSHKRRNEEVSETNYRNQQFADLEQDENEYQDDYQSERPRRQPHRPNERAKQPYRNDYAEYEDDYRPRPAKSKLPLMLGLVGAGLVALAGGIYFLTGNAKAQILAVSPNYVTSQQPYQDCRRVATNRVVRNHKNGTDGAIIGGATGAVAGGIIGNQVHGGGGGTAVGAIAGGAAGALIGRDIQRSDQPNYVTQHGSATECRTLYRQTQNQVGYNVQYLYKDNMANMVTQVAPAIGSKMSLADLEALAVPPAQLNPTANH